MSCKIALLTLTQMYIDAKGLLYTHGNLWYIPE